MREADQPAFQARLDGVSATLSRGRYVPDPVASAVFFVALEDYPLHAVLAAFAAHVKDPDRGRFPPVPADLIAKLEQRIADDGRPGSNEAWAIALSSADERETVVWSAEMAEAFSAARSVLDAGDEVGARMAFRETYDRLVAAARSAGRRVDWQASLGTDPDRRALALAAAVRGGRATGTEHDAALLPAPGIDTLLLAAGGIDPALTAEAAAEAEAARAAACAALRDLSARLRAGRSEQQSADGAARDETQRRKAESAERAGVQPAQPDADAAQLHLQHVRDGGRP